MVKLLGSDRLFLLAYARLTDSKTLLWWLQVCLNFTLNSEDLFCWFKWKKMIYISYGSRTSSWKPLRSVRLDLTFMMKDIYIISFLKPFTKFTSSTRNTKFKDILLWSISQLITKTIPISTRIVINYGIETYINDFNIMVLILWSIWN